MAYRQSAFSQLNPTEAQLFNWLIRYHAEHGGRRASRAEMRKALNLSREPLNNLLANLTSYGLFETETDDSGKARSYTLPGESWHHPHISVLEARDMFFVGSTIHPS